MLCSPKIMQAIKQICQVKLFHNLCLICSGPFASAMGRVWHPDHFACSSCNKTLQNTTFIFEDEKIFCEPCYQTNFSQTCFQCKKPILGVGVADCSARAWLLVLYHATACTVLQLTCGTRSVKCKMLCTLLVTISTLQLQDALYSYQEPPATVWPADYRSILYPFSRLSLSPSLPPPFWLNLIHI